MDHQGTLTIKGAALHLLLLGGYALWGQPSRNQMVSVGMLTLFQSSQFYVKEYFENEQSKKRVQFFYDVVPFIVFASIKTHLVATAAMGTLFLGVSRFVTHTPSSGFSFPLLNPLPPRPPAKSVEEQREEGRKIFVDFYLGRCPNTNGVMIEEIWKYDRQAREAHHNFIQWIFPSRQVSRYHPTAPTLNPEIIAAFKGDSELRKRLERSFELMLTHYGLELTSAGVVQKSPHFEAHKNQMLGHNSDRITRILGSLKALGREDLAQSFFACLFKINEEKSVAFNPTSFGYWASAASGH